MSNPQKAERHYDGSDDHMTGRATVIQSLFADDLASFTGFDGDYDADFRDDWLDDINAAQSVTSDEVYQDQLRVKTEAVEAAMVPCRDKWDEMKYFVKKAFPHSSGKQAEFGADNYDHIRKDQKGMIRFMELLHEAASEPEVNKPALLAVHCIEANIDEIASLRTTLSTAELAQERHKALRGVTGETRIGVLNIPYDKLVQVCAAAQIVFISSAGKRAQYVFLPGSHPAPTDFSGTVAPDETKLVGTISYVADKTLNFTNTGATELQFVLRVDESLPGGAPFTLAAGAATSHPMADLNDDPTATKLIVTNLDGAVAGAYHVVVT